MTLATNFWILNNIRETWDYFSQTVSVAVQESTEWELNASSDPAEYSFRTPIAYLDRSNSFEGEDRASCGADAYDTEQNPNEGARVGLSSWSPALPPAPPTPSGQDGWTSVKMLDNVFEHDSNNNNGIVTLTQSLEYRCEYVEMYYVFEGKWKALSADMYNLLFPDGV